VLLRSPYIQLAKLKVPEKKLLIGSIDQLNLNTSVMLRQRTDTNRACDGLRASPRVTI
jgi:hypothetical protein